MSIKITKRIKPEDIRDKTVELSLLKKYYKMVQQQVIKKTSPDAKTDYFMCMDFVDGEPILIIGTHSPAYKRIFREAAKGKHGFIKTNVSIGSCYFFEEEGKKLLCVEHNASLSKGKPNLIQKALKKMQRRMLKGFTEVRWMTKGDTLGEADTEQSETTDQDTSSGTTETNESAGSATVDQSAAFAVSTDELITRFNQLQQGVNKFKNDVIPKYKKGLATPKDGKFIEALMKAGQVIITKYTQVDPKESNSFRSQIDKLKEAIEKWSEIHQRIIEGKKPMDVTEDVKKVIQSMNDKRNRIKELLKEVNLSSL